MIDEITDVFDKQREILDKIKIDSELYMHAKYGQHFKIRRIELANFAHDFDLITVRLYENPAQDISVFRFETEGNDLYADNYFGFKNKRTIEDTIEQKLKEQDMVSAVVFTPYVYAYQDSLIDIKNFKTLKFLSESERLALSIYFYQDFDCQMIAKDIAGYLNGSGIPFLIRVFQVEKNDFDIIKDSHNDEFLNTLFSIQAKSDIHYSGETNEKKVSSHE